MKTIKTIAKAVLTVILIASAVLLLSESATAGLQLLVSGGALLICWLSYKGLDALGTFDTVKHL